MSVGQEWEPSEVSRFAWKFSLEEELFRSGYKSVAGLDEVGRGPLAGPVVAAAVILPRKFCNPGIRDSKLLTARRREYLSIWIKENSSAWGVGIVDSSEIDRINILQASLLAMANALKLIDPFPDYLLIDGIYKIPDSYLVRSLPGLLAQKGIYKRIIDKNLPAQKAVKHGDRICISIAAASIIAKVTRDKIMVDYDRLYPGYGFADHKGYGSPAHLDALSHYGPSAIHRRSFKPLRNH